MNRPASRLGRRLVIATLCCAAAACGPERPARADWTAAWEAARAVVPSAEEVAAGGQALCDELLGRMRQRFAELDPPPAGSLDDVVESWVAAAESLAFDCPTGDELRRRIVELEALAAEIDAGLQSGGR